MIHERIFDTLTERKFILELGILEDYFYKFDKIHILFTESHEVIACQVKSQVYKKMDNYRFNYYLSQIDKTDFSQLLFLLTAYFGEPGEENFNIVDLIKYGCKFSVSPELDIKLSDSFGFLFYQDQIQDLYCQLTGSSYEDAILFRKNWNIGNMSYADTIMIKEDLSLLNYMTLTMITQCFHCPLLVEAQKLDAYLKLNNT